MINITDALIIIIILFIVCFIHVVIEASWRMKNCPDDGYYSWDRSACRRKQKAAEEKKMESLMKTDRSGKYGKEHCYICYEAGSIRCSSCKEICCDRHHARIYKDNDKKGISSGLCYECFVTLCSVLME